MGVESYLKRLEKIFIHKLWGSNAWHKKWQCSHYHKAAGSKLSLVSYIDISELSVDCLPKEELAYVAERYCEHRFDYLGSGWVNVEYGASVLGVEGFRYEAKYIDYHMHVADLCKTYCGDWEYIQKIRNHISEDYNPICWNRDYKSGHQWANKYLDEMEALQIPSGADIKTVWELGRMEFVLQLALGALALPQNRKKYITEFKNVVLDFICNNPVGLGVNWILPMEASIRVVNFLLSYDILCQIDEESILDEQFDTIFAQAIYEHGRFIYDNGEGSIKRENGNHYYSNVIGLIYVGAYLQGNPGAQKWYRHGMREYMKETVKQFFSDGGNIEASTSYHRLMTEMAIFGAAIMLRRGNDLPIEVSHRLGEAIALTRAITKSSGDIVQIGDNDSARLVNAVLYGEWMSNQDAEEKYENLKGYCRIYGDDEEYFDENILNHRSLIEYGGGLCGQESTSFENSLIKSITGKRTIQRLDEEGRQTEIENGKMPSLPVCKISQYFYETKPSGVDWGYYPCFGIYYYKEGNMEFYLYTGGKQGRIRQGHSHNDIMHCELCIDGKDILVDRGTYLYIDNGKKSQFRGRVGHFVPDYGAEPRKMVDTWGYEGEEHTTILCVKRGEVSIRYNAGTICHYRCVQIGDGKVTITDCSENEFRMEADGTGWYSNGYGKLQRWGA